MGSSRQKELEREGWVRQFTADEPRLSEAVELYESLGFEVHLEPVTPGESAEGCQICFEEGEYKTIYTRKRGDLNQDPFVYSRGRRRDGKGA